MSRPFFWLGLSALLLSGCGSNSSDVSTTLAPSAPSVRNNTLRLTGLDPNLHYGSEAVGRVEATGFDSAGKIIYGPMSVPHGSEVTFTSLPDATTRVHLELERDEGYTLATDEEQVDFVHDDDGVIEVKKFAAPQVMAQGQTFTVKVVNNSAYPDDQVYVSVNGKNRDATAFYYLQFGAGDNNTAVPFGPVSDFDKYSVPLTQLQKAEGDHAYSFSCPYTNLVSGRIYLSFGKKLQGIGLNNLSDPLSLQLPSPTGAPDYQTLFEFMELSATIPKDQSAPQVYTLFANTSVVDFFSMGLGMTVNTKSGNHTVGFVDGARDKVLAEFEAPTTPPEFREGRAYVRKDGTNSILRVLSPVKIVDIDPGGSLNRYLDSAIDSGWAQYAAQALNIPDNLPDHTYGYQYTGLPIVNNILSMTCTVSPSSDPASRGEVSALPKPTTKIIFFCDDPAPPPGPVQNTWTNGGTDGHKRLCSLLSSALNRGVFETYANWGTASQFYTRSDQKYNHYSRIMHKFALDNKVYGFGYDDVYGQDPTIADTITNVNQVVITIPKVPQL